MRPDRGEIDLGSWTVPLNAKTPLIDRCLPASCLAQAQVPTPPAPAAPAGDPVSIAIPAAGVQPSYVIGPGDVLQVFVWRNPELTITVPVRPHGGITTPLVEEMTAANKTAEQLARDIEKVVAEYVRSPQVNVIVVTPRGVASEVKVVGQVKSPQGVPFRAGMTVLDLVLAVGGLYGFRRGQPREDDPRGERQAYRDQGEARFACEQRRPQTQH